ncbi:MAG: N-6 DNA methylase [Halothiobacillaceae bacterium]
MNSAWGGERLREAKRKKFFVPPEGNANFAWVQHMIHHLAPTGLAGFVLAKGSMSSTQSGEMLFMSFDKAYCGQQRIQAEPNGKERGLTQ